MCSLPVAGWFGIPCCSTFRSHATHLSLHHRAPYSLSIYIYIHKICVVPRKELFLTANSELQTLTSGRTKLATDYHKVITHSINSIAELCTTVKPTPCHPFYLFYYDAMHGTLPSCRACASECVKIICKLAAFK